MEEFKPKRIYGRYYVHNFKDDDNNLVYVTLYQMLPKYMSLLDMSKRKLTYFIKWKKRK